MYGALQNELTAELARLKEERLYKSELVLASPQSAHVEVEGLGSMLNFCAKKGDSLTPERKTLVMLREFINRILHRLNHNAIGQAGNINLP